MSRRLALAVSISAARRSRRIGGTGPSRKLIGVVDVLGGRCSALRVVLDEGESLLEELGRFVAGRRQVAGGADSLPVVHLRGQVFWAPAVLLGDSWLRLSSAKAPILARPAPLEQDGRGDGRGISRRVCAGHRNVPVRPSLVKTICAERSCHAFVARGGGEGGALPCFADRIARPGCRCGGGRQRRPTRSRFSTRGAGRAAWGLTSRPPSLRERFAKPQTFSCPWLDPERRLSSPHVPLRSTLSSAPLSRRCARRDT